MASLDEVTRKMRADWDRRVAHDYRFWMSDGEESDEAMWQAGQRDFELLMEGISPSKSWTALELGCGVGRLLRPALREFRRVIGVDISEIALAKARELLRDEENLELVLGNGVDIQEVTTDSVDVAYSFAAITSCPTKIIAGYLLELSRVVRQGGHLRLQLYLGSELKVGCLDTLHLRCFAEQRFLRALEAAGFAAQWIRPLILPFDASCQELGIEAKILAARKFRQAQVGVDELETMLLEGGAEGDTTEGPLAELERFMVSQFASSLQARGDRERAERASAYALCLASSKVDSARQGVNRLANPDLSSSREHPSEGCSSLVAPEAATDLNDEGSVPFCLANLAQAIRVLESRGDHPELIEYLKSFIENGVLRIPPEARALATAEGPCLELGGRPLDNPTKPVSAARVWRSRNLTKDVTSSRAVVVFGFGGGYEIEELLEFVKTSVILVVPRAEVLVAALSVRDLSRLLERVDKILFGDAQRVLEAIDKRDLSEAILLTRPQSQALAPEFCSEVRSRVLSSRVFKSLRPSHAVIGPLQGGTLPITGYVHRALEGLRQRSRMVDLSGFAPSYHQIEGLIKDKVRQTLLQNSYVEVMTSLLRELRQEKPFNIAIFMAQAPVSLRLLEELRSQGVITVLWFVEDYLRFTYWRELARGYDFIFTVQRGACIEAIKKAGAGEVYYLPVACDPGVHRPLQLSPEERKKWGSPISFVGAGYHNRQQVFAALSNYPIRIWGTQWPEAKPFDRLVQEDGRRLTPEEYVKIFNATDININLHSSDERDGVDPTGDFLNPRLFELAAAGAFQLVDERTLMPEIFTPGHDVATFRSTEDLKDKLDYYLAHPEERNRISRAARETVLSKHTYAQRLKEMLAKIYSSRYEHLRDACDRDAWGRMLKGAELDKELHQRCNRAFERGEEATLDGLVADIVAGDGRLTETEQKLLFLFHVRKQMILIPNE